MPRILKPDQVSLSGDVVPIPDVVSPRQAHKSSEKTGEEPSQAEWDAQKEQDTREEIIAKETARAEEMAKRIIALANADRETILEDAGQKAEAIRAEAERSAVLAKTLQIENLIAQVDELAGGMVERHLALMRQIEKKLPALAISIAEKILAKKLDEDETQMTGLVRQAVASIRGADWISVEVSERMPELVRTLRAELAGAEGVDVQVAAADLPRGSCIVHTPTGDIDASVAVQLAQIQSMFTRFEEQKGLPQ